MHILQTPTTTRYSQEHARTMLRVEHLGTLYAQQCPVTLVASLLVQQHDYYVIVPELLAEVQHKVQGNTDHSVLQVTENVTEYTTAKANISRALNDARTFTTLRVLAALWQTFDQTAVDLFAADQPLAADKTQQKRVFLSAIKDWVYVYDYTDSRGWPYVMQSLEDMKHEHVLDELAQQINAHNVLGLFPEVSAQAFPSSKTIKAWAKEVKAAQAA